MDTNESTTEVTPQETSTTEAQSSEVANTSTEPTQEAGVETGSGGEVAEKPKPTFTPDYKLKVYDNDVELKDDFLKSLIKDADSEKKVKEIAQKYMGFEVAKEKAERYRQEFGQYAEQAAPIVDYYQKASSMLQKGDLESFFELVGIPQQEIYKYAVKKAQEEQLDPVQQQQLQQQRQIAKQKEYLESQNQTLQQQQQAQMVEFRKQELNWVLARPEVSSVMSSYDSSHGPNAFLKLVRRTALDHYEETGGREDLSAEQAIQKVFRDYPGIAKPAVISQPGASGQPQLIQQDGPPPVIPNVSGRAASPVRKKVSSIADIKKRYEDMVSHND